MGELLAFLNELIREPLVATIMTVVLTPLVATYFGLRAYRLQAKELIDGAVAWRWTPAHGGPEELPFLVIQNRSPVPAYLVRARWVIGVVIKKDTRRYAFSYDDPTDEHFPMEIGAQGVTKFPLSFYEATRLANQATWPSRWLCYLMKGTYLWIEIRTISGHRLRIPANYAATWDKRPRWIAGRWLKDD